MYSIKGTKKYVVLGCGGFIGSHFLDRVLREETIQIEGFDPDIRKIAHHIGNPRLTVHPCYLKDAQELLPKAVANADAVINLAAICNPSQYNTRPLDTIYSNFIDAYPIVELCARHKKWLIHYSTSEVYGRTLTSYLDDDDYTDPKLYEQIEDQTPLIMGPVRNQRWSYAAAKQLLERFIYGQHKEHGMPFTVIRPFNFFGPRMDFIPGRDGEGVPRVLACFITALLDGEPLRLVDGGLARRTITSIHDATEALMLILQNPEKSQNQAFNVANREAEVTIAELAQWMRKIYAAVSGESRYLDHPIVSVSADEFYGEGYEDCDRRVPDLTKITGLLGWQARRSLEETLIETVQYYYDLYGKNPVRSAIAVA